MRSLLAKFPKLRVLVVGDVMLDEYVWGDAQRLSPEAPVPIVVVERETHVAGGSANVAHNVVSFGAKAELCGWVGQDAAGMRLRLKLKESQVKFDPSFARENLSTIVKTRVVARRQQLCRLDREADPGAYALLSPLAHKLIEEKLGKADALIFSDYGKGTLNFGLVRDLGLAAKKLGLLVAMDPKPRRLIKVPGLDLLTPNWREALEMAGYSAEISYSDDHLKDVIKKIQKAYKPRHLVVTLGDKGMALCEAGGRHEIIPTAAREVFDVTGAGDTVIAALTLGLAAGATLKQAAEFANTAAGVVVGKFGTATATPEEVLKYHPQ